jgi:hypothetical protein
MDLSASDADDVEPVLLEDRILTWTRVAAEIVTLIWVLDVATHGDLTNQIKYRVREWKLRRDTERQIQSGARHVLFEAVYIIDSAWRAHHERHSD